MLALERKCLTKTCWLQVLTTLLGMAVVDVQRWDRSMGSGNGLSFSLRRGEEDDDWEDFDIKEMANIIAKPLRTKYLRYRDGV